MKFRDVLLITAQCHNNSLTDHWFWQKGICEGEAIKKGDKRFTKYYQPRFMMINAWNYWIEGGHHMTDIQNGYCYQEAVRNVINNNNE